MQTKLDHNEFMALVETCVTKKHRIRVKLRRRLRPGGRYRRPRAQSGRSPNGTPWCRLTRTAVSAKGETAHPDGLASSSPATLASTLWPISIAGDRQSSGSSGLPQLRRHSFSRRHAIYPAPSRTTATAPPARAEPHSYRTAHCARNPEWSLGKFHLRPLPMPSSIVARAGLRTRSAQAVGEPTLLKDGTPR